MFSAKLRSLMDGTYQGAQVAFVGCTSTSPPCAFGSTTGVCNRDPTLLADIAFTFDSAVEATAEVLDGATPGQIGMAEKVDGTCQATCDDVVPDQFATATAVRDAGDHTIVRVIPDAELPWGKQFKFSLRVEKEGEPGCPTIYGPFCFGTACQAPGLTLSTVTPNPKFELPPV